MSKVIKCPECGKVAEVRYEIDHNNKRVKTGLCWRKCNIQWDLADIKQKKQ